MTREEYKQFNYVQFVNILRASSHSLQMDMLHSAVGISGESGELLDHMKKVTWQGHDIDYEYMKLECGDILFYLTSMCSCLGITLDEVRKANIEKLIKRYPDRKFDPERSKNR
jgi:NTP pyrophosphatase (non-canonical NTP hydrolase)